MKRSLVSEINKEIIAQYSESMIEIYSKGESHIEKALYLVHLTDWVSYYLAELREMDPVEVKNRLRNQLKGT